MKKDPKQISLDFDRKESHLERKVSQNLSKKVPEHAIKFVREVETLNLSLTDFCAGASLKRELIPKYFKQHRYGAKQNIIDYSNTEIGKLCNRLYYFYKGKM